MSDVPEMVERVKRAFLDTLTESGCRVVDAYGDSAADNHIADAARAAMAAMREPTEAMVKAGEAVENEPDRQPPWGEPPYAPEPDRIWRAMIDAALS